MHHSRAPSVPHPDYIIWFGIILFFVLVYSVWLIRLLELYKDQEGWVFIVDEWGAPIYDEDEAVREAYRWEQQGDAGRRQHYNQDSRVSQQDPYFQAIRRTLDRGPSAPLPNKYDKTSLDERKRGETLSYQQ